MPKRVCIVGAGVSGLPSIKACLEEGHIPVCYEKTHDLGGLWNYRNLGPGEGTVMRSTVVNTSKGHYNRTQTLTLDSYMMSYSDYPPPEHWPNFMPNSYINQYLHDYAAHFRLLPHIHLGVTVKKIRKADDYDVSGAYVVLTSVSERWERFDGVMICTGHHSYPYYGHVNGLDRFTGQVLHAQVYHRPEPFADKNVLLIGFGNSALDISIDLATVAKQTYISTRRGAWIMNRLQDSGLPFDTQFFGHFATMERRCIRNGAEHQMQLRTNHEQFGLRPAHGFWQQHPTVNDHLNAYLITGQVLLKDDVADIDDRRVRFTDGSEADDIDVIILCTGYTFGYPFLDPPDLVPVENNHILLYKTVFPADLPHPTLSVIGLIQPYGAIQPIAELQARWYSMVLSGERHIPARPERQQLALQQQRAMLGRYYKSQRNTIQVDYLTLSEQLAEEIGCQVSMWDFVSDPALFVQLWLGSLCPYTFRLQGPHRWSGARAALLDTRRRVCQPLTSTRRAGDTVSLVRAAAQCHELRPLVLIGHVLLSIVAYFVIGATLTSAGGSAAATIMTAGLSVMAGMVLLLAGGFSSTPTGLDWHTRVMGTLLKPFVPLAEFKPSQKYEINAGKIFPKSETKPNANGLLPVKKAKRVSVGQ